MGDQFVSLIWFPSRSVTGRRSEILAVFPEAQIVTPEWVAH